MKIEAFGFQPVMGKEYVVTFTQDGELLSTSIYNGAPLEAVSFPDNSKVGLTITDKETGKTVMSSEFISYNGKLYKSVFNLPLKNTDSNLNANVYIKDLHYDLTTGSVLVQIQGFAGDSYKLNVSDTTVQHKTMAMDVVLADDMYYSIPTELVQGNNFEVTLQDEFGKAVDSQTFTAPISTDWRYTDTVENGQLVLDEEQTAQDQLAQEGLETQDPTAAGTETNTQFNPFEQQEVADQAEGGLFTKDNMLIGVGGFLVLMLLILIIRMIKKRKAKKAWEAVPQDYEEDGDDDDDFPEVDPDELAMETPSNRKLESVK